MLSTVASTHLSRRKSHRRQLTGLAFILSAVTLLGCGGGDSVTYVGNVGLIPEPVGSVQSSPCVQVVDLNGQVVGQSVCFTSTPPSPPRQYVQGVLERLPGSPASIKNSRCLLTRAGQPLVDPVNTWIDGWNARVVLQMSVADAERLLAATNGAWSPTTESEFLSLLPCNELPDAVPSNS